MTPETDREFFRRLAEQMRADQAKFEAKFEAATRRKLAALEALKREVGEREQHAVSIAWDSVRCPAASWTSGTPGQIVAVAQTPRPKRRRWRWF
jgi:hypothetical protein